MTSTTPATARPEPATARPPRGTVLAWALWDTGSSAFNAVMTTFVFTVYLTSPAFGPEQVTTQVLSAGLAGAGVVIAVTAPVLGQRADRSGFRRRALALTTGAVVACVAACFLVRPDPAFLWLGVGLIGLASVFSEIATVHYNALLPVVSTRQTVGRVSGTGWAMGYFGGIAALGLVLVGLVSPGLLGVPHQDALNVRSVALFSAAWLAVFSLPVLLRFPSAPVLARAGNVPERTSVAASYRALGRLLVRLRREQPGALRFFIASAVFRDGLAGVFSYGGVLAAGSFGFSMDRVIVFAILGNLVAGLGAVLGGRLDDALGPRRVIIGSLAGLLAAAGILLALRTPEAFWACGLALCGFVGPAQSASRTYLSRITPPGREGEWFGLYSTTGRAMSFLAPAMFGISVAVFGAQVWGVLGIMVVLAAGLVLALGLPAPDGPLRGTEKP